MLWDRRRSVLGTRCVVLYSLSPAWDVWEAELPTGQDGWTLEESFWDAFPALNSSENNCDFGFIAKSHS